MQIDKELIHGKIDIIERNITFLSSYKEKIEAEFLSNYKDIQAIKYSLFEIIEACIDIASHIISAKGFQRAESYAEMFEILGKNDIIETQLSEKLSNMARFRNVLVHGYAKIDNSKVLVFTKEKLIDVENFIKAIIELIKE
ncbi:MAG: DUF86 domain-containing protein [Candidatus Lokiarchaeota archaeon]|nr:DUF86 domain-containing protein [Candidatus Lokiarchaeota archaeon]